MQTEIFIKEKGTRLSVWENTPLLHLETGSSACSFFPAIASALPAPTIAAREMVPCARGKTMWSPGAVMTASKSAV